MEPKRGGSRKPVDYNLVTKLALLNPSNDELGALYISRATLYRRLQDDERLREILEVGRHGRRMSLKRAQWKAAMEGNTAILIWLGKNELGQREPERRPVVEITSDFSVEEVQAGGLGERIVGSCPTKPRCARRPSVGAGPEIRCWLCL